MKPQVEEVEDDLVAEEENKLINEVRSYCEFPTYPVLTYLSRNTKSGMLIAVHVQ